MWQNSLEGLVARNIVGNYIGRSAILAALFYLAKVLQKRCLLVFEMSFAQNHDIIFCRIRQLRHFQ